jgi:uncharacterized repeat protein (TIGR03803 family)
LQYGVAFKIKSKTGAETVLHDFRGGADGGTPFAGLTFVGTDLFGATTAGGAAGIGTIFKIGLKPHRETVLHSFSGVADGANPAGTPVMLGGNLCGVTTSGPGFGVGSYGTVWMLTP